VIQLERLPQRPQRQMLSRLSLPWFEGCALPRKRFRRIEAVEVPCQLVAVAARNEKRFIASSNEAKHAETCPIKPSTAPKN
jgi:hypothetical protein